MEDYINMNNISIESICGCITEILREIYKHPEHSVYLDNLGDIANDALCSWRIPLIVDSVLDDDEPFVIYHKNTPFQG